MLHHKCSTGLYIDLRKFWNLQSEAKFGQINAIVTTHSVFLYFFLLIAILNQWLQIIKRNTVLFTKKSQCRQVMVKKWLIVSGLILALAPKSKSPKLVHSAAFTATRIQFPKESQFLLKRIITIWRGKLIMPLKPVQVYFTIGYTINSFQPSSPGQCTALLFWFSISKCIKHYPISILQNWQRVPNPYENPSILLTTSPPLF